MTPAPASGLLVLDKPSGLTSHDCVATLRHLLKQPRIGHAGTLDPLARGVLLVLTGDATSEQSKYMALEKEYWLRAEFGVRTESGDRQGRAMPSPPYCATSEERLSSLLRAFQGPQWQAPPRVSAVKVRGRRLYDWTRSGVDVDRAPREILIHHFELLRVDGPFWEARVICSRGTYIRTLAEDVGAQLGTGAVLDQLIRERIGPYSRRDARTLESFCRSKFSDAPLLYA